ncbi:MAG: HD-GYP domain-containing protein, partial [Actinomycetota bacterium]|nr:HD-GYP domain-containing protein [Actinomycetota bacterium]
MAGSRPDSGREHGSARASSAQPHPDQSQRWVGHPVAAMLVRLAVVLVPPGTAVAAAAAVSRRLPSPHGLAADVLWWSVLLALSTAVLVAADRVLRRVLPLAALLQMSVLFPGRAPSRFAVARQAGSTRRLGELVRRAELAALRSEPVLAAERILALVAALDGHDRRTHGHAERVRVFTDLIAEEMRLPQADRDRLRWASLLHDIGKISVPSALLNKAGKPSVTEWDLLRRHPDEGARLAAPLLPWLGEWGSVIDQHHERYDGLGYPRGLAGTAICPGARIVAVADSFEVMTAPRAYKRAMNRAAALQELARCAGSQFDPAAVRALLQVSTPRLRWAMGPLSWLAQVPLVSPASSSAVAGQAVVGIGALAIGGAVGLGASGAQAGDAGPQGWPADAAQSAAAVPVGAGSAYD